MKRFIFLLALVLVINGKATPVDPFRVEFERSVLPTYNEYPDARALAEVALHYFINQQSDHDNICLLSPEAAKVGEFRVNALKDAGNGKALTLEQCLRSDIFDELYIQNNPYSCRDFNREISRDLRLDWMINQMLKNYSRATGVPRDAGDIKRQYGVSVDYANTALPRKVIPHSMVTQDRRVIGVMLDEEKRFRGILTWDFNKDEPHDDKSFFETNPAETKVDALEIFFKKKNRLRDFMLHDVARDARLEVAPGGVADFSAGVGVATAPSDSPSILAHGRSNAVRNGVDCMICHSAGALSLGVSSINKQIVASAVLANVPGIMGENSPIRQMYGVPVGKENDKDFDDTKTVEDFLVNEHESFQTALTQMQVKDLNRPILPDIDALFQADLSLNDVARELGHRRARVSELVERSPRFKALLGLTGRDVSEPAVKQIRREVFNASFCRLQFLMDQDSKDVASRLAKIESLEKVLPKKTIGDWANRVAALERHFKLEPGSPHLQDRLFEIELKLSSGR